MKKDSKRKKFLGPPREAREITDSQDKANSLDVAAMIDKIQRQLVSLEGKIDSLIMRPQGRPAEEQRFSRSFRHFEQRERTFTRAICADCKKECEVPFRPSGDRPVYCKECFARRKEGTGGFKGHHENKFKENEFIPKHAFDKHRGGSRRKGSDSKKPSFRKRKGRP